MTVSTSSMPVEALPHGPANPWRPGAHSLRTILAFSIITGFGILAVLFAWGLPPFADAVEGTEDAYIQGHTTVISPQVSGYVQEVKVDDYEQIQKNQILIIIDPSAYRQRLEQAKADLDAKIANFTNNRQALAQSRAAVGAQQAGRTSAEAVLVRSRADLRRSEDLVKDGSLSTRENDQNIAAVVQAAAAVQQANATAESARQQVRSVGVNADALRAAVEGARAQVHAAEIDLSHTVIRAPGPGRLSEIGARLGQFVTNGTALLFLVPDQRWVSANFKEKQTRRMREGQKAWFTVDALGRSRIRGRVERISPATGSEFSVLKADNATGNFTKVPQRITVRITIDAGQSLASQLRPGMSVEAHVDTATSQ